MLFDFSARKLSASLPVVVLVRRNEDLKPKETLSGVMTAESVVQFVRLNSLPVFVRIPYNIYMYVRDDLYLNVF